MRRNITQALAGWLAAGLEQIGQIRIQSFPEGGFELCHFEDLGRAGLALSTSAQDARALCTYDDAGNFRPLKTAPNLRHGWKLTLPGLEELRAAIDTFYPAMLGSWLSFESGELSGVPLRETLGRQSGMYACTRKLTDAQADELAGTVCNSACGCLKTILWPLEPGRPIASLPAAKFDPAQSQVATGARILPMLCGEACNLLVAAAREVVKKPAAAQ